VGRLPAGPPGLTDALVTLAREWAERSCLDQGLAVKIRDPRTLRDVAQLLGASVSGSDPPDGGQPGGVEAVVPTAARTDEDVVEHGGDDRVLSCEGQVGPTLPQGGRVADVTLKDRDAASRHETRCNERSRPWHRAESPPNCLFVLFCRTFSFCGSQTAITSALGGATLREARAKNPSPAGPWRGGRLRSGQSAAHSQRPQATIDVSCPSEGRRIGCERSFQGLTSRLIHAPVPLGRVAGAALHPQSRPRPAPGPHCKQSASFF